MLSIFIVNKPKKLFFIFKFSNITLFLDFVFENNWELI